MSKRKWQTLTEELAELEATAPDVAEAARRYDEMVWRITHPEDCANPMRDVHSEAER